MIVAQEINMLGIAPEAAAISAMAGPSSPATRTGGIVFLEKPDKQQNMQPRIPAEEFGSFLGHAQPAGITLHITSTDIPAAPVAPPSVGYCYIPVGTRVVLRSESDVRAAFGDHYVESELVYPLCGYSHIGEVVDNRERSVRVRFAVQSGRFTHRATGSSWNKPRQGDEQLLDESTKKSSSIDPQRIISSGEAAEAEGQADAAATSTTAEHEAPFANSVPTSTAAAASKDSSCASVLITVTVPHDGIMTLCDFLLLPHQPTLASLAGQGKHAEMVEIIDSALRNELAWANVVSTVGGEDGRLPRQASADAESASAADSSASGAASNEKNRPFNSSSGPSATSFLRSLVDLSPPALQLYLGQPLTAPVLCLKSLCQLSVGDLAHALQSAALAVSNDPSCAEGYLRAVECLILLDRVDEAAVAAATCVSNCPLLCDEFKSMWLAARVLSFAKPRVSKADVEVMSGASLGSGSHGVAASWCHPLLRRQLSRPEVVSQEFLARSVRCRATRETKAGAPVLEDYASVLLTSGISVPSTSSSKSPWPAAAVESAPGESQRRDDCGYCGFPLRRSKEELIRTVGQYSSGLANIVRKKYVSRTPLACEGGCGLVFCSEVCRDRAYVEFHELECGVPSVTKLVTGPVQQRRRTVDFSGLSSPTSSSGGRPSFSSPFLEISFIRNGPGRNSSVFSAAELGNASRGEDHESPLSHAATMREHSKRNSTAGHDLDDAAASQRLSITAEDGGGFLAPPSATRFAPVKPKGPSPMLMAMMDARRQSVTVSGSMSAVEGIRSAVSSLTRDIQQHDQALDNHAKNSLLLLSRAVTTILSIFFPCPLSMIHLKPNGAAASSHFVENVVQNERQAHSSGITWDRTEMLKNIIKKCDDCGITAQHGLDSNFRHTFSNRLRTEDSISRSSGYVQMNDVDRNSLLLAEIVCHEVGIPFFSNPFLPPEEIASLHRNTYSHKIAAAALTTAAVDGLEKKRGSPAAASPPASSHDMTQAFQIAQQFFSAIESAIFSSMTAQQSVAFSSAASAVNLTQQSSSSNGSEPAASSSSPHSSTRHDSKSTPTTSPQRTPLASLLSPGGYVSRRNSSVWTIDEDGPSAEQSVAPSVWKLGRLLAFFRSPAFLTEFWDLVVTGQVIVRRSPLRATVGPYVPEHLHSQWDVSCDEMQTAHVALCPVLSACSYLTYGRTEEERYFMPCKFPRTPPSTGSLVGVRSMHLLSISSAQDLEAEEQRQDASATPARHPFNLELDPNFSLTGQPGRRGVRVIATRVITACEELVLQVW